MLFNSIYFLFFLPSVVFLYYSIPHKFRWILLFVASSFFYMFFYPPYILILYAIILIDYLCGLWIENSKRKWRFVALLTSILANIALLSYFKYYNFFIDMLDEFALVIHKQNPFHHLSILLPIGLSFHTFQSLSYTIEVYRKKQKAEKHIGYFANYVLFFPQMVAGPIERFDRLGTQLHLKQKLTYDNIANGSRLVLYGLFVKMCIADNFAPLVDEVYTNPQAYISTSVWISMFAFSIQIYADFYGYSTIAIGAARMLGIDLMDNFRQPYFATGIQNFWQRWHISLSTWFRDYVFFSMGGSKVNNARWLFNILVLFAVSGFWHGANYTFIIWGCLHGLAYLLDRFLQSELKINFTKNIFAKIVSASITFFTVTIIWVFFRSESFEKAIIVLKQSLHYSINSTKSLALDYYTFIPFFVFLIVEILIYNKRFYKWIGEKKFILRWFSYLVLLMSILLFSSIDTYPFIYFQF